MAGREVGQSYRARGGNRRSHGQDDWAKDAPTDTAAQRKPFDDETSERDGDQKRSPGHARAGGEKDEQQDGGDETASGAEKRCRADRHGGADQKPHAIGPERYGSGDGGDGGAQQRHADERGQRGDPGGADSRGDDKNGAGNGASTRGRDAYLPEHDRAARPHESQLDQQRNIRTGQQRPQAEPRKADRRKENEGESPDDGRTAKEVSESEGIPLGTAKTRIRTGLQKLRISLEEMTLNMNEGGG